jgi:UDP:flavonoid glycosyltransferase YjiC (YdhE family)
VRWDLLAGDEGNSLIDYIPGVPTLQPKDLPSFLQDQDPGSQYILELVLKSLQSSRGADWILCNSFDDLESTEMKLEPPVFHVGPLLPSGYLKGCDEDIIRVGTNMRTEYDCSAWLNTKPNDSVIYVSFGSMIHLSKAQLEEVAMGLKDSGQPFLWVVRPDIVASTVSDCLPDGFLDEIGSQGLVVPWCNQLRVLSHPSVAGFITHCGWNSMLESIAFGVPMLGFPAWSEQYTNCKLMADEWKIGIRLKGYARHAGESKMVAREEICGAIRKLLSDEGKKMKINVEALSNSAKTATMDGGSSHQNIETFVQALKATRTKLMKTVD